MTVRPLVVLAEFETTAETYDAFLALCSYDSERSVADEEGCHAFDVLTPEDEPNVIVLHEIYTDRAAFEAHLKTPHFAKFDAGLTALNIGTRGVRFLAQRHPGIARR